jgi:hypothetical protein
MIAEYSVREKGTGRGGLLKRDGRAAEIFLRQLGHLVSLADRGILGDFFACLIAKRNRRRSEYFHWRSLIDKGAQGEYANVMLISNVLFIAPLSLLTVDSKINNSFGNRRKSLQFQKWADTVGKVYNKSKLSVGNSYNF